MNYNIYAKTNEHPRTINTYQNARTYYTKYQAQSKDELLQIVNELKSKNIIIQEICTNLGTRIYL